MELVSSVGVTICVLYQPHLLLIIAKAVKEFSTFLDCIIVLKELMFMKTESNVCKDTVECDMLQHSAAYDS
jgi:hypothetical protein